MSKTNRIAIIPARGGSKRIPRKNIKLFCGKPIIAYSIEAALETGMFDEVMVSTEDEEIKEIAIKYGANVPFLRSSKTAGDYATTADVLLEVLEQYKELGRNFDVLSCIYSTAPFVTPEKLRESLKLIEEDGIDSVIPVVGFSFPPQRGFIMKSERIQYKYPEYELARSQDLETMYHDAGQFYCVKVNRFLEKSSLIMENTKPIIVDEMEVQDIDNESDWRMAEFKYKVLNGLY